MMAEIEDSDDLIRALRAHPEWRQELRRELLTEELLALPERVSELAGWLQGLFESLPGVPDRQTRLEARFDHLQLMLWRQKFRDRAVAYCDRLLARIEVLDWPAVIDRLDAAQARLSPDERREILDSDVILQGRRRSDQAEVYLLAEVALRVELADVYRAAQRARVLARATERPVVPAVGGLALDPQAGELAAELEVAVLLEAEPEPEPPD